MEPPIARSAETGVLFTGSTFPRWRDDTVPDFVWRQVQAIRAARPGLRAAVLAPHDRGAASHEHWDGVHIRRFRYFLPGLERLVYPAIWPNLRRAPWLVIQVPFLLLAEFVATLRWLRRERFDLVYSHWFMPQGVACGLAALLTGTPHVFTSHSSDVAVMRKVPVVGPWLVRFVARRARAISVVSQRSRGILESFFTADEWRRMSARVAVIPMGVDLNEWRGIAEEAPAAGRGAENERTLLFIGRLAEKKGVEYLLEALTLEPLRATTASLVIAGDGPLLGALQTRVRALGLDSRVRFAGHVAGDAKRDLFRRSSVVVVPSIITAGGDAEGVPVVLLEALAAGRVCVATDASGAPDVLRGGDAFVVPQRDPAALASTIADALALAPDQRRAMQARARETAARYDWPTIAAAHVRHLIAAA